jgi:hypothetical protein
MSPATDRIPVLGQFDARDRTGLLWRVKGAWIPGTGHIPDLTVDLERGARPTARDAGLAEDDVFLGCLFGRLHEAGYLGPRFGRADRLEAQAFSVVLEPGTEFDAFAMRAGFRFLD